MSGKEPIQIVCLLTLFGILFMIGQTFVSYWTDPAAFYVRPMFMLDWNKRYFNMKNEWMEHKEVLDSFQKSIHATSWPQNGVEGLIRKTINLGSVSFVRKKSRGKNDRMDTIMSSKFAMFPFGIRLWINMH